MRLFPWKHRINPPVFIISTALIIASVSLCLYYREEAARWFEQTKSDATTNFGWLLIITANLILFTGLYFAFGKYGKIRIGGEQARPEFSMGAWFAMLFSAGMGIGLLFYGIAEPLSHYTAPPMETPEGPDRARMAMGFSFLHWGLHAWGIYALVALGLAFFTFNRKLPLAFRSLFYPFLGEKINGWAGHIIDILAVLATIFGLATTLGIGVKQMSAGMNHVFETPDSNTVRIIIIVVVTLLATGSVVAGLDRGIKVLSNLNVRVALVLMLLIFILGPTLFLLKTYVQNTGYYLSHFLEMSFWNDAYQDSGWQNEWTIFYWTWWIAWSPFVGTFIARISKGRTIREFMLGVLIVPSLLTFLWFTIFGSTALYQVLGGDTSVIQAMEKDHAFALFSFLEHFPLSDWISVIGILLIVGFFVTSSDSGSLVIDAITSGGHLDSPVWQRIFWAFCEGLIALVLMLGGGLEALQTAVILAGIPFAIVLLLMSYSLYKGLNEESFRLKRKSQQQEAKSYREIVEEVIDENTRPEDKNPE